MKDLCDNQRLPLVIEFRFKIRIPQTQDSKYDKPPPYPEINFSQEGYPFEDRSST